MTTAKLATIQPGTRIRVHRTETGTLMMVSPRFSVNAAVTVEEIFSDPNALLPGVLRVVTDGGACQGMPSLDVPLA